MRRKARCSVVVMVAAALVLCCGSALRAQSFANCAQFGNESIHERIDCLEALFSAGPLHLTFSSLPPGNGFALGAVLEQKAHYVSPFAYPNGPAIAPGKGAPSEPDTSTKDVPTLGSLWSSDARLAAVISMNGSWLASGMLTVMPKGYVPSSRKGHDGSEVSCNRLGFLCTRQVFGLHMEGTHRSLQTLSFYGLGPHSPGVKYIFHENDTWGTLQASLPLADWLKGEAGFEYRQPDLPASPAANSVSNHFSGTGLPGLASQPGFAHSHVAVRTNPVLRSEPATADKADNHTGPLAKRYLLFTFRNDAEYHWYAAQGDFSSSFQQFVLDSDENIQLGAVIRHYVQVEDIKGGFSKLFYYTLAHACGDTEVNWSEPKNYVVKVRQLCRLGNVDLRAHLVASRTGTPSQVPFYLEPTVGGSDIDSRPSLRGYPDYRFRDRDAHFVQAEYKVPVCDPAGLIVFYDAGTVGPTVSGLSWSQLRQDAGLGITFYVQGNVAAQAYLAWGAGHGPKLGYSFTKFF